VNACRKDEADQSGEPGRSEGRRSDSLEDHPTEGTKEPIHPKLSMKDLLLAEQSQSTDIAEQRREAIRGLSSAQLIQSIRSLDLLNDGTDRMILRSMFLVLAEKDPSRIMEMLDELPGDYYKVALAEAFPYLARENPDFLKDFVKQCDFEGDKNRWLTIGACENLGKENPKAALVFFEEISDNYKKGPLGISLLKQAASEEPTLVVEALASKRTAPYFVDLFRDVLYTVLEKDPAYADELASSYPEVRNDNLSAGIYTSMARKDPKWAIEEMAVATPVVRLEILTRPTRDNSTYFSKLFSEDPERTIKLLNGIVPSTANSNLFQEAADHLSSLPAGPVRDTSVRSFAEVIRPSDPETADRWIESLR